MSSALLEGVIAMAALAAGLGALLGSAVDAAWRQVHGDERTVAASLWLVLPVLLAVALAAVWVVRGGIVPEGFPAAWFVWGLGLPVGLGARLLRPVPEGPCPAPIADHDGVEVQLTSHSALASALALYTGAWLIAGGQQTVRIRVQTDAVAIGEGAGRPRVALRGLTESRCVRWAGTPLLVMNGAAEAVEVPVGGAPPAQVDALVQAIVAAAATAPEPTPHEVPAALRALRARAPER
ncbi:MAG: hypothetical protein R3F59_00270 [Myxococcota bacterium]